MSRALAVVLVLAGCASMPRRTPMLELVHVACVDDGTTSCRHDRDEDSRVGKRIASRIERPRDPEPPDPDPVDPGKYLPPDRPGPQKGEGLGRVSDVPHDRARR